MARNFKRVRISSTPTAPTEGKEPIAPTHEGKEPTTPTNEAKESTASILAEKEASATRHDREDGNAIGEGPSETDITDFTTLSKSLISFLSPGLSPPPFSFRFTLSSAKVNSPASSTLSK